MAPPVHGADLAAAWSSEMRQARPLGDFDGLLEAAEQQRQITRIRLEKLVRPPA